MDGIVLYFLCLLITVITMLGFSKYLFISAKDYARNKKDYLKHFGGLYLKMFKRSKKEFFIDVFLFVCLSIEAIFSLIFFIYSIYSRLSP